MEEKKKTPHATLYFSPFLAENKTEMYFHSKSKCLLYYQVLKGYVR